MTDRTDLNSIILEGIVTKPALSTREDTPCFTCILVSKRKRPALCADPTKSWNKPTTTTIRIEAYGNKALRYADALHPDDFIRIVGQLAPKGKNSILIIAEAIAVYGAAL